MLDGVSMDELRKDWVVAYLSWSQYGEVFVRCARTGNLECRGHLVGKSLVAG